MRVCRPRRAVLRGAGGLLLAATGATGQAREPIRLLVAGAPGGRLAALAAVLAPALQAGWPGQAAIELELQGGDDGVTGANQFEAAESHDAAALLLPGSAAAAWLAGDPRVHFDAARWLPLLCGLSGGLLAGRRRLSDARTSDPLRLAVGEPLGPAAACLLGLDLLRVAARPVSMLGGAGSDAAGMLRSRQADAAFMRGARAAAAAAVVGATPLLTLGAPDLDRDEAGGAAPSLAAWLAGTPPNDPALLGGWSAIAAAVQLDFVLVLSALTDAADVATWRRAAAQAVLAPAVLAATGADIRAVAAPGCNAVLGAIATSSAALLAYRRWLAGRLGYQLG